jgi:hypothetical protein
MTRIVTGFVCLCLVSITSLFAQEGKINPKDLTAAELEQVDDDFAYQGEYVGSVNGLKTGLQVIALGGGKFEALALTGGLPGAGWDGQGRWRMNGERTGTDLIFSRKAYLETSNSSDPAVSQVETTLSYDVDGEKVRVSTADGKQLGALKKVHRKSPTLGLAPPWEATTLFDGDDLWQFRTGFITEEGWLETQPGKREDAYLKHGYQDFILHVEFRVPYQPYARGQGRGNSGCYLQSRYEVQILDSFGLDLQFNDCGSLYRVKAPDLNMCLPPLSWQTYDIVFHGARFNGKGEKTRNVVITVWHNGVKIHDHFELDQKTGAGKQETPEVLVTRFQDHGNPVRFRNLWIIDLKQPVPAPMAHPDFVPWSPEQFLSKQQSSR